MLVEPRVFRFADIEAHRHSHVVILKARGVACLSGLGECDERAKSVVKGLAEELGFVGVDCGALERAQLVEAVGDFIRFQIIGMGLGPYATISLNVAAAS